jgi:MoxR-like ATPase
VGMSVDEAVLREKINQVTSFNGGNNLEKLKNHIQHYLVGQAELVEAMLLALLCDGHVLIEGMPGLAKTTAAKALAHGINAKFHRIQFTPDLLPADLIGSDIFLQDKSEFSFKHGPIFQNIILADEINRAPAKVQSALLEVMEEKQVTVGHTTYKLPDLFMVLATQNPIDQEGTYSLPEAQLDRFMLNVLVKYPTHTEELEIISRLETKFSQKINPQTSLEEILSHKKAIHNVHIDIKLKEYIVSLVQATRNPGAYNKNLENLIQVGASPRATIAFVKTAKALAWLQNDAYVLPDHIQYLAHNILRHRIIRSFAAEAEGISVDQIISDILQQVAIP